MHSAAGDGLVSLLLAYLAWGGILLLACLGRVPLAWGGLSTADNGGDAAPCLILG